MKKLQKDMHNSESSKKAEEMRVELKRKVDSIEEALAQPIVRRDTLVKPPQNLKPGDSILIVSLNQKGTVLTPPDKNGEALIQAGIMKVNIHVSNLKLIDEQKSELKKSGFGDIGVSKAKNINSEIDIRGYTLEEALESVDKYLDDALIAGLSMVSIIHGKGTGTLRNGIHKYLRSSSRVKAFRLGKYGEGESGVTIIELK